MIKETIYRAFVCHRCGVEEEIVNSAFNYGSIQIIIKNFHESGTGRGMDEKETLNIHLCEDCYKMFLVKSEILDISNRKPK